MLQFFRRIDVERNGLLPGHDFTDSQKFPFLKPSDDLRRWSRRFEIRGTERHIASEHAASRPARRPMMRPHDRKVVSCVRAVAHRQALRPTCPTGKQITLAQRATASTT